MTENICDRCGKSCFNKQPLGYRIWEKRCFNKAFEKEEYMYADRNRCRSKYSVISTIKKV